MPDAGDEKSRRAVDAAADAARAGIDGDRRSIAPRDGARSIERKQRALADAVTRTIGLVFSCDLALGLEIGEQRKMHVAVAGKGRVAPHTPTEMPSSPRARLRLAAACSSYAPQLRRCLQSILSTSMFAPAGCYPGVIRGLRYVV